MKAVPLKVKDGSYIKCEPLEATHLVFNIPGPIPTRIIPVMIGGSRAGSKNWTWNGDTERPTVKPSVLTDMGEIRCHSWINDGKVIFLDDCTHEFAGQTLDLLEVEWE